MSGNVEYATAIDTDLTIFSLFFGTFFARQLNLDDFIERDVNILYTFLIS